MERQGQPKKSQADKTSRAKATTSYLQRAMAPPDVINLYKCNVCSLRPSCSAGEFAGLLNWSLPSRRDAPFTLHSTPGTLYSTLYYTPTQDSNTIPTA